MRAIRIPRAYAEAFADIMLEARQELEKTHGLAMPPKLTMTARRRGPARTSFFTDGVSHFHLTVSSMKVLRPSTESGVYNVYGICHEMGHIAMYRRMENLTGLSKGIGEGWAHYAGSVVIDAVAARLGEKIWPEVYDVASAEGTPRLKRQVEEEDFAALDDDARGAKVFWEAERRHGRKVVFQAMGRALSRRPVGADLMRLFVEALGDLTGQSDAGAWIPSAQVEPRPMEWKTAERKLSEAFFEGLRVAPEGGGVLLAYDDGGAEGDRSVTGSGHAVAFRAPAGFGRLDRVDVFGSRYGTSRPPKRDWTLFVCDESFRVLHRLTRPYGVFPIARDDESGKAVRHWVRVRFGPVAVPRTFYVCVAFAPTSTRGVYMALNTSVRRSHSRYALPGAHVKDAGAYGGKCFDWMIRAHLRK